jgi:hypothetical protein
MVKSFILLGMRQSLQVLGIEGLAVLGAAMAFVALQNDWSSFGTWILAPRCDADLVVQTHIHDDGTRHTHAHFLRRAGNGYIPDLRDERPAADVDGAPFHVLLATSKAGRQRGWLPPDCD